MKRILPLALALPLVIGQSASAAPVVTVKPLTTTSVISGTEAMALSGKNVITFSNITRVTSDVVVTAIDPLGAQAWTRTIDTGSDEIATAMTSDATGVIWIAGVRAEILQAETSTSLTGIDNPDNVIVDGTNRMRADLDVITIWKISPVGELLATYSSPQTSVALIKSIFVGSNGISLIGQLNGSSFLLTATLTGFFSKIFTLGTDKTSFNDVVRLSDGSSYIFGSSSETLQGKKVAGKTDGLLLTADKNGKFTQLVRSSAPQALRDWQSADSTLVTTGSVRTGKNVETAITQFSKAFKPTWTLRVQSLGTSRVVAANGMTYLAISSQSAITGISGWKPSAPTLLVIAFDAKGVIKAASSFAGLSTPLTLKFTREAGLVGTAVSTGNTVSIFRAGSR